MMASRMLHVLIPGLLPALMAHAGGWAVITVQDLPDYVEAGKQVDLSYMVRQHGHAPVEQLRGSIQATSGRLSVTGTVSPGGQLGRYAASITLPSAGEWSITIRSGFGKSDITLVPLAAVEHGTSLTRVLGDVGKEDAREIRGRGRGRAGRTLAGLPDETLRCGSHEHGAVGHRRPQTGHADSARDSDQRRRRGNELLVSELSRHQRKESWPGLQRHRRQISQ